MILSEKELERYRRHLIMDSIGPQGQQKIAEARVLIIGVGGLGCPAALYLNAVGVGYLGIVDSDVVVESNLHRQVLFGPQDVGVPKVEAARKKLQSLNPGVTINSMDIRVSDKNIAELIRGYDVVLTAVDNFCTRFMVNDACTSCGVPFVEGGVREWQGRVLTVIPGKGPCLRCLFPSAPENPPGEREPGVFGVLPGIIGTLQALEVIKVILKKGSPWEGRMLTFDGLSGRFHEMTLSRREDCPVCSVVS